MKLIYLAIIALGAFIAIWFFFIAPAERRHHERKLEMVRKRIEQREAALAEQKRSVETGDGKSTGHSEEDSGVTQ